MEDTRQPNGRGAAAMQTLVCTPKNFYPSVLVILVDPIRAAGIAAGPATGTGSVLFIENFANNLASFISTQK